METKGRFEPVEINKWLGAHSISVPEIQELDDTGATKELKQKWDASPGW